tara:strand:+ start:62 stop:406 length:345 start_codon:yes stop_codon:yes gene_type:complete
MEKYLSIHLTTPDSRNLISAEGIIAISMNSTSTVKIWYKDGKTITIELSAAMASNDDSIPYYLFNQIAKLQEGTISNSEMASTTNVLEIPTPLPNDKIWDATGNYITLTAITIA